MSEADGKRSMDGLFNDISKVDYASHEEQAAAGIHGFDTAMSASDKILRHRMAAPAETEATGSGGGIGILFMPFLVQACIVGLMLATSLAAAGAFAWHARRREYGFAALALLLYGISLIPVLGGGLAEFSVGLYLASQLVFLAFYLPVLAIGYMVGRIRHALFGPWRTWPGWWAVTSTVALVLPVLLLCLWAIDALAPRHDMRVIVDFFDMIAARLHLAWSGWTLFLCLASLLVACAPAVLLLGWFGQRAARGARAVPLAVSLPAALLLAGACAFGAGLAWLSTHPHALSRGHIAMR